MSTQFPHLKGDTFTSFEEMRSILFWLSPSAAVLVLIVVTTHQVPLWSRIPYFDGLNISFTSEVDSKDSAAHKELLAPEACQR